MQILKRSILPVLGILQFFLLLAALAKPAYGYVDPGSGLLFFQVGSSMLAGAVFMLRAKIRKLFRRKPEETTAQPAESGATHDSDR